jgi:glycosyltransferase involved in cell wall biosynthesis
MWPKSSRNIINMDGLEWKRSKYNKLTQSFLKRAEKWAATYGNVLIADSIGIQDYLQKKYQKSSIYIPYGATIFDRPNSDTLVEWKLDPQKYFLVIARMEPENNIEMIIEGFLDSAQPGPLVIVGNTNNRHGKYLRNKYKHPLVVFAEGIYDQEKINNLRFFSRMYFHGHSVGGTNPSLLMIIHLIKRF